MSLGISASATPSVFPLPVNEFRPVQVDLPTATPSPEPTRALLRLSRRVLPPAGVHRLPFPMVRRTLDPHGITSIRPGQVVALSSLPALHAGKFRRLSATGATIVVTTQSGCGTTVGTIYNVGCVVQWQSSALPACTSGSCHQDYYINANAATATAVGSAYGATAGAANVQTLSNSGTYVFATLNSNTNNWDAIVYVTVGSAVVFDTYSDSTAHNEATTFTASTSNTVYVIANGLTPTDLYVVYVESTSVSGHCAFIAPPANPTPGPTLCNPLNSAGQNAVNGQLNVGWQLSASLTAGTYSIVIYDLTTGTRLAQRQIAIVSSGASSAWSITPVGGNSSPNPIPAGTPGATFAYDGSQDQSDRQLIAAVSGLATNHPYTETVSDPNGYAIYTQGQNSDNNGNLTINWNFQQTQSPENYVGHTYTLSLLDKANDTVTTTKSFALLGYFMQVQFTNPTGTALAINPPATSATSGVQFTNGSDLVYGVGNGDSFRAMQVDTGSKGVTATLDSNAGSCGTNCTSEVVTDTAGGAWVVTDIASGGGVNADSTITLTPFTAGETLGVNASVVVPNVTFNNPPGSHCTNGCTLNDSVLPADGLTWSLSAAGLGANPLYVTNGFGNTYAASAHIALYGETAGGTLIANDDAHGFAPNFTHALYDSGQPFTVAGGAQDVLAYTVTNSSSAGSNPIQSIDLTLPTSMTASSAKIDTSSPSTWSIQACPNGTPANVICLQKSGSNNGIPANGGSQTIYIDINPPTTSFAATDVTGQVTSPAQFAVSADGTATVFAGSSATVDSTALMGYSLDSSKIVPLVAPATVGANTNPAITINVTNTTVAADADPDDLDAVAIDVPSATPLSAISTSTSGWSYLGSTTSGGNTRYWFGECSAQLSAANGPATNPPPPLSASLPNCGQAMESTSSLGPGAQLTVNATIAVASSSVTMTEYAHGANGDGWSKGTPFTLGVSTLAVTAGFSNAGMYGSPPAVATNTTPQTAADTNATYGDSYVYEIKNISATSSGQIVTGATIKIPGSDTSGANGADASGMPWTITAAPTLTLSGGAANCSVTSYASATAAGADGSIVVGGASCLIPPGATVDVKFSAKAPYKVGSTYKFSTSYTGGTPACSPSCSASEAWFTDTDVSVVLSANLVITVDPSGTGPGGSNPAPSCAGCTYGSGNVNFGSIANGSSVTGSDVLTVSVYTDAANLDPWKLYVSTDNNPANTGTPANELLTAVDSTASNQGGTGLNIDQTALTVVPTSGPGSLLADTGGGAAPRRLPYDLVMNYQVSIQGGSIAGQTSNVTFTFIAQ
jgi:hypothetical protein